MSSTPLDSTTPPGGMREAIKSAARSEVEGIAACWIVELSVPKPKLSNIFGLIFVVLSFGPKSRPKMEEEVAKHQFSSVLGIFHTPCFPPKSPAQSAGPPLEAHKPPLESDQNFDHFLTSIFGRFGVVLGHHLGVMFGPFGDQVRPSSAHNAS